MTVTVSVSDVSLLLSSSLFSYRPVAVSCTSKHMAQECRSVGASVLWGALVCFGVLWCALVL